MKPHTIASFYHKLFSLNTKRSEQETRQEKKSSESQTDTSKIVNYKHIQHYIHILHSLQCSWNEKKIHTEQK